MTAALTDAGTVYFWGSDFSGESANPDNVGWVPTPVRSFLLECIVEIRMGSHYGCARDAWGSVSCWGSTPKGLPVASGPPGVPRVVPAFEGATRLSAGGLAGVITDASPQPIFAGTWSNDLLGPMWITQDPPGWPHGDEPRIVLLPTNSGPICGGDPDGHAWCFGHNDKGQIGDGTTDFAASPREVLGLSDVVEIAATGTRRCARLDDGRVACWGQGPLGDGTSFDEYSAAPVYLPTIDGAVSVATGWEATCVASADDVWCWGVSPASGSPTEVTLKLNRVDVPAEVVEVAVGLFHACGRTAEGEVFCWGGNKYLGVNKSLGESTQPQRVTFPWE